MVAVGPLDGRRLRLRCLQCSSSHLKCGGVFPCKNCTRSGKKCRPPKQAPSLIFIQADTIESPSSPRRSPHVNSTDSSLHSCALSRTPSLNEESYYLSGFFMNFLQQNNFTGRSSPYTSDIAGQLASHKSLYQSTQAIGALQTSYSDHAARFKHVTQALLLYKAAVSSLRQEVSSPCPQDLISISWSTFLLGLFELMYDDTGQGWLRHLLYGTSRILQSLSPQRCRHGAGMRFFLEIRPFEIARAMLFAEPTFLATEQWAELTESIWSGENIQEWSPKERLLDIMTSCTDLSYRASLSTRSKQDTDLYTLVSLAGQGMKLRSALHEWEEMAYEWAPPTPNDQQMTIAWIFHAAISIYLSGIYDYSRTWVEHGVITPTLDAASIDQHVTTILNITSTAVERRNLAGVLFLFPLRIVGARAQGTEQKQRIRDLIRRIAGSFRAANAFLSDLEELWADPKLYHDK